MVKVTASYLDVALAKKGFERASLKVRFVAVGKEDKEDATAVVDEVALQKSIQAQAQAIKLSDVGDFNGARQVLAVASADLRNLGTDHAMALADVQDGLAADELTSQSYARGGSSKARSLRKGLSRKRFGASGKVGGVNLRSLYGGTRAVEQMMDCFEAPDEDELSEDKPPKAPSKPSSGVSKSRSRSSW
jgi:hypothetical protein